MSSVYSMDQGQPKADMEALHQDQSSLFAKMPKELMGITNDYQVTPLEELQQELNHAQSMEQLINLAKENKDFKAAPLTLNLSKFYFSVTDEALAEIVELFPNIKELNLAGCTRITDAGLAHIEGLKKLQSLNLDSCYGITDAGFVHLKGLSDLQKLNLVETSIADEGFGHLKTLSHLQELTLWSIDHHENAITDLKKALPKLKIIVEGD